MNDHALLQQFRSEKSEQAFAELVRGNVDLVYSSALRQTTDPAMAEDVTQKVFILLAHKAQTIRQGEALAGWLLATTRYAARNALRGESRRRRHEREAAAMKSEIQSNHETGWDSIKSLLDEAVAGLKRDDRDAITLRYFKGQSMRDVAGALGISEAAAQKRVGRALERLREVFGRRGVKASSEGLASLMAVHATTTAPEDLTSQIIQHALVPTLANTTKGAVVLMAATKTKIAIAAAIVLAAGVSTTVVYRQTHSSKAVAPAVSVPQTPPAAMSAETARDVLASLYGLQPGENLKRIEPPFPPERSIYYRSIEKNPGVLLDPDAWLFKWNGQGFVDEGNWVNGAPLSIGYVLKMVIKIWPQDTDLPPAALSHGIPGDWVIRSGATQAELVADFVKTVPQAQQTRGTLKPEMIEREVIVVRGEVKFTPLPDASPNDQKSNLVLISRSPVKSKQQGEGATGWPARDVLLTVGEVLRCPVVIETTLDDKSLRGWRIDPSADFRNATEPPDGIAIDEVLDLVARQTSLDLKRERRTVQIWRYISNQ